VHFLSGVWCDFGPALTHGPLLPLIKLFRCCGAARQTGLSLQLQNPL
jgi:hypothetical protein